MKRNFTPSRSAALALLMAASALPLTSAMAQDAPPVTPTEAPAPPVAAPATSAPAPVFAPRQEVAQPTPPRPAPVVAEAPPEVAAPAAAAAQRPRRAVPRAKTAPVAAAPVAAAPIAAAREPATRQASPPVAGEPVAETSVVDEQVINQEPVDNSANNTSWLPILGGLLVAGAIAAFLLSRRRRGERVAHAAYDAPTDGDAVPVAEVNLDERPWIRLALEPRPAASATERTVEYELTVENEGRVPAHDVRVSSFMLADANSSPEEAALTANGKNTRSIDVAPGETVRLAGSFDIRDFVDPKLIADARYALPDGSEGHLAAKFGIDLSTPERAAHVEDVLDRV